jgi:hypothetical protein
MRFWSLSATILAAAGAVVAAPQDAGETTIAQVITSATTTYTITRTVERVVQTTYATLPASANGTVPTGSSLPPGASLTLTPYANGTASGYGSSSSLSGTAVANQTAIPMMPPNAGASLGSSVAGVAAVAGLAALLLV